MSNTGQTPYDNYKSLLGYLSSYQTVNLANENIELMHLRIAELESVIRNVTLIAEYPPKDRAILDELSKLTAKD